MPQVIQLCIRDFVITIPTQIRKLTLQPVMLCLSPSLVAYRTAHYTPSTQPPAMLCYPARVKIDAHFLLPIGFSSTRVPRGQSIPHPSFLTGLLPALTRYHKYLFLAVLSFVEMNLPVFAPLCITSCQGRGCILQCLAPINSPHFIFVAGVCLGAKQPQRKPDRQS